jgi:hypothetical protein
MDETPITKSLIEIYPYLHPRQLVGKKFDINGKIKK